MAAAPGASSPVLARVVARALPLLLLFTTFLFINAEVWQVAGTLTGARVRVVALGSSSASARSFVLTRVPA